MEALLRGVEGMSLPGPRVRRLRNPVAVPLRVPHIENLRRDVYERALLTPNVLCLAATAATTADPLPSWNEEAARSAMVAFVERVTKPGGAVRNREP